jgi:hypothetical protein
MNSDMIEDYDSAPVTASSDSRDAQERADNATELRDKFTLKD